MKSGYFRIEGCEEGYGLRIVSGSSPESKVKALEVKAYLDQRRIPYDAKAMQELVKKGEGFLFLEKKPCPVIDESFSLFVSEDSMSAVAKFYPPSETGAMLDEEALAMGLVARGVRFGIQKAVLRSFLENRVYGKDILAAVGQPMRPGQDAYIEYAFDTKPDRRPAQKEDGSADFFSLNIMVLRKPGDVLATLHPEQPGEPGCDVCGRVLRPPVVKKVKLPVGKGCCASEDGMQVLAEIEGHVELEGEQITVSPVFMVKNVDISTGNIDFPGSVVVNGNVSGNFSIKATGHVSISGWVEAANIQSDGDILIQGGMNGTGGGSLEAGGNIMAKYLENVFAMAGGEIISGSVLHSEVLAGIAVRAEGKKGNIMGGRVSAGDRIDAGSLGGPIGIDTVLEVGGDPRIRREKRVLQEEISEFTVEFQRKEAVFLSLQKKNSPVYKGRPLNPQQMEMLGSYLAQEKQELEAKKKRLKEVLVLLRQPVEGVVEVSGVVYPGAVILVGDAVLKVQQTYKQCRFTRHKSEIRVSAI